MFLETEGVGLTNIITLDCAQWNVLIDTDGVHDIVMESSMPDSCHHSCSIYVLC
jgi:hypothetical protein